MLNALFWIVSTSIAITATATATIFVAAAIGSIRTELHRERRRKERSC